MLPNGARFDRYIIEGVIGEGGMGIVYRARDEKLHRSVALKVVRAEGKQDETAAQVRMLREARATAALHHPNVIVLHDVGEFDGGTFLAMELLSGSSLRKRLGEEPKPTLSQRLQWLLEVARALSAAHAAGLVHRDVKPDNVFITEQGVAKVLDFGIARKTERNASEQGLVAAPALPDESEATQSLATEAVPPARIPTFATENETQTSAAGQMPRTDTFATAQGALVGTPLYMAPEQLLAQSVDGRTDQFAWGVLAYELLTGALPWVATEGVNRIEAILVQNPVPLAPELAPTQVREAVLRALEKDPSKRFSSMHDIVRILEAALLEKPKNETSAPSSTRFLRGIAIATALAVLVIVPLGARAYRARRYPLHTANSVLACPQFEATGVDSPSGWLGAAAASLVCLRATAQLSSNEERTLSPAELLDAPRRVSSTVVFDPFGNPGARERSVTVARARADAWVDGRVSRIGTGFEVTLVLRNRAGASLAEGTARGAHLLAAVAGSMQLLVAAGGLPEQPPNERDGQFMGITDPRTIISLLDFQVGQLLNFATAEECEALSRRANLGRFVRTSLGLSCQQLRGIAPAQNTAPVIDRSSPIAFGQSALTAIWGGGTADYGQIAEEARRYADRETSAQGRALLLSAEHLAYRRAGNAERAREAATQLAAFSPKDLSVWAFLVDSSHMRSGSLDVATTGQFWQPYNPRLWLAAGAATPRSNSVRRAQLLFRSYVLSPWALGLVYPLTDELLASGRHEEVRGIVASLAEGSAEHREAREVIMADLQSREGAVGAAFARCRGVLSAGNSLGDLSGNLSPALHGGLELAIMLGREEEFAREILRRYVLSTPPLLVRGSSLAAWDTAMLCLVAPTELARTCGETLHRLRTENYFGVIQEPVLSYIIGTERYAQGDLAGMAAAWRPIVRTTGYRQMIGYVLDKTRQDELGALFDETAQRTVFNGASMAVVRDARRAHRAGDHARARTLANQVLTAWRVADVEIPLLAEMRTYAAP